MPPRTGANYRRLGEISLAHRGVLCLDEVPAFAAKTHEDKRRAQAHGIVTILGRTAYGHSRPPFNWWLR
jgi:hypothetical protein